MKETLQSFADSDFPTALDHFFDALEIPVHKGISQPGPLLDFLNTEKVTLKDDIRTQVGDAYLYGIVDEKAFQYEEREIDPKELKEDEKEDYDGILLFGIEMKRSNPTRTTLAEITRLLNRSYNYTPVVVVFRYGNFISFANCERLKYKQQWREGEKAGKVSLLRDVSVADPHPGHLRILNTLTVEGIRENDRRNKVQHFDDLFRGWMRVFNTDILNEQFYRDYQQLSVKLIRHIYPEQVGNKVDAHQGALNLLNRLMFIYFVQEKGWMMDDPKFLIHFWHDYNNHGKEKDTFHKYWLNKLFFSTFNGKAIRDPDLFKHLPDKYHSAIVDFPYLNGGLFTKHAEYDNFLLPDHLFEDIFDYLESYIFTISEDTAEDINLEINPELLGKMYEGMINATDLDDVEAENGIIYTERPEINFMTRRSFVEVLNKKLGDKVSREFLYHFIFDKPEANRELLDKYNPDANTLKEAIFSIRACDPACGSGSMLLGVIQLQMELIRVLDEWQGQPHTPKDDFDLKKQLISESIYGVDIKEWAVRIAELRLWLYMIAESEFSTDELTETPLLPNLDFKIRCGNSLLPKLGSLDFDIKKLLKGRDKRSGATRKLNEFIKRKKQFIRNELPNESYNSLKDQEVEAIVQFVQELISEKNSMLYKLKSKKQSNMFGDDDDDFFTEQRQELQQEVDSLEQTKKNIKETGRLPFSYDIDFMEVFLIEDDPGFDLIIGNPPYVRQEDILPPEDPEYLEYLLKEENADEKKEVNRAYKKELSDKVYSTYPFLDTTIRTDVDGTRRTIPIYGRKVPGRSDLYVYFQLLCPQYLNSKGTFCFIISNSWLDVDYGSFVQHFYLKHTILHAIYDSNVRSFSAKVNTVIYLHSSLVNTNLQERDYKTLEPVENYARFIMNKTNYTDAAYAPVLIEQENCSENTFREFYRVIFISQRELFDSGFDEEAYRFLGDKWGGKYLRAPEIFYQIVENERFCDLRDIAEVTSVSWSRLGYNSEVILSENEVTDDETNMRVLKSPRDLRKIEVRNSDLKFFLNIIPEIEGKVEFAELLWVDLRNDKHLCHLCDEEIAFTHNFHGIRNIQTDKYGLCYFLNSTLAVLFTETIGRGNLGEGAVRILAQDLKFRFPILPDIPNLQLSSFLTRKQENIFEEIGINPVKSIREQDPSPLNDRAEIDNYIFESLGLSTAERNEVYWSVAEMVKQRLFKAASR